MPATVYNEKRTFSAGVPRNRVCGSRTCPNTGKMSYSTFGGDEEDRTLDLTDANRTLSQLSYAPKRIDHCVFEKSAITLSFEPLVLSIPLGEFVKQFVKQSNQSEQLKRIVALE